MEFQLLDMIDTPSLEGHKKAHLKNVIEPLKKVTQCDKLNELSRDNFTLRNSPFSDPPFVQLRKDGKKFSWEKKDFFTKSI